MSGTEALSDRWLAELRPKLHRYCARMTGSVIDGEDVVQEALIKAVEARSAGTAIVNAEGWLFRIAHNAALDFLRRRARRDAAASSEGLEMLPDPTDAVEDRASAATSLRSFMRLSVMQRSSVILMDVLGYSLDEIGAMTASTLPAVKAALHRGRTRLREIAQEPEELAPPRVDESERARLTAYVDRFNARDFDAIRDMLADEVRLELVARTQLNGRKEVGRYFHNYSGADDWCLVPGFADGRAVLLVCDPRDPTGAPTYFIVVEWAEGAISKIRDFRHARYAIEGAELRRLA
jgi:RNA polymerase sigma-70 factor (ECF subfamily)